MARLRSLPLLALLACATLWAQTPADSTPPPDAGTPATAAPKQDQADNKVKDNDKPVDVASLHHPVLWHDPGRISELDLFYGQGGKDHQPAPPFKFDQEDLNGTNPKFDADDANGKKWRVKLGAEARPEVVASRLLWAMGFYAEDDYVLPKADIANVQMKRKPELSAGGHVTDARFARKPGGEKKIGIWQWKNNPFTNTKEFNGLRVMMAVMNNWDLKDINNAVFSDKKDGDDVFLVSDIGATFATNDLVLPIDKSKGNLDAFKKSRFITRETATEVDFATPAAPAGFLLKSFGTGIGEYAHRKGFEWIGKNIPRSDAKWMGSLLSQLSHDQLVAAFKAGNFPPDQIAEYVVIVEDRIMELKSL
jgi:hypothetical protein